MELPIDLPTTTSLGSASAALDTIPSYTHQALDTTKEQIRLIKLRQALPREHVNAADAPPPVACDMATFDLDTAPEYIALSYVWGDPDTLQPILVNNKTMHIRQNLFDFLCVFRNYDTNGCYLWIDQITIDQGCIPERNQQVQLMSTIYKRCRFVIAWLGLSSQEVAEAFISNPCLRITWYLLRNRYFSRVWIVQEVMLPPEVRMLCGNVCIHWDDLTNVILPDDQCDVVFKSPKQFLFVRQKQLGRSYTLERSIRQFAQMECQDPRDKVYGMIGILPEHERPRVDYEKRLPEVYIDVVNRIEELGQAVSYDAGPSWFPPELDEDRIGTYQRFAIHIGVEDYTRSQLREYFEEIFAITSQVHGPRRVQMGFERADPDAGTPDRWWYEFDDQKRCYHIYEPPGPKPRYAHATIEWKQ